MKRSHLASRPAGILLFVAGLALGLLGGGFVNSRFNDKTDAAAADASRPSQATGRSRFQSGDGRRSDRTARDFPPAHSDRFADAVRSLFVEPDQEVRLTRFRELLDHLDPRDYPKLVGIIRENDLRGGDTGAEWTLLWQRWGKNDPAVAMEFIRTHDWTDWSPMAPAEARNQALVHWAQENPDGAVRYVEADEGFINGDRSLVLGLVRGWTVHDPEGAARWLFENDLAKSKEYEAIVQSISRSGGYERLDSWFDAIKDDAPPKDLAGLAQFIINKKMTHRPDVAIAFLEAHLDEPWAKENGLASQVVQNYAQTNPEEALRLAERIDDAAPSLHYAFGMLVNSSPKKASQWLSDHPDIPIYDRAAFMLSHELLRSDREEARRVAESIRDESIRGQVLQMLDGGQ